MPTIIRRRVDLREVGGPAELAKVTAMNAVAALESGFRTFYSFPGGVIVEEGDDAEDFRAAAQRAWLDWADRLRRTLGNAVRRRSLRETDVDLVAQLAWRGVLIEDGVPASFHTWTPGERHQRHVGGIVPSLEDLQQIAGPVEPPTAPELSVDEVFDDFETATFGQYRIPVLARGSDRVVGHATVDWSSRHRIARHTWEMDESNRNAYVVMRGTGGRIKLHGFVMGGPAPEGASWDHVNKDRFDNRRLNLRAATPVEQARNRKVRASKGYRFHRNGWEVRLRHLGETHQRRFPSEEAARAYVESVRGRTHL